MKNLTRLAMSLCLVFFSCEVEKVNDQEVLEAVSGKSKKKVKEAKVDGPRVIKECTVINADRCDAPGYPQSVFWWPIENEDPEALFSVDGDHEMTFTQYDDGSINVTGKNILLWNGCETEVNLWLINQKNYTDWSAGGGDFKDETPYGACSDVDFEALDYYIVDETRSTMTATNCDDRDGDYTITHRPDSMRFGFQFGAGGALYDSGDDLGLSGWAWAIDSDGKQHKLDFNFVVECDSGSGCETAYARGTNGNTCFTDSGFGKWGWTIGPLAEGQYTYDIYAGAGQCDITKGELVGTVDVDYSGGNVEVTYNIDAAYEVTETHTYAGSAMYPTKNGKPTVAPGQFSIEENLSGEIYVIAHAVVCRE